MFGGGGKAKEQAEKIAALENELRERSAQLQRQEAAVSEEKERAASAERERIELQRSRTTVEDDAAEKAEELKKSEEAIVEAVRRSEEQKAELTAKSTACDKLKDELAEARQRLESAADVGESASEDLRAAQAAQATFKSKLAKSEHEMEEKEQAMTDLKKKLENQKKLLQDEREDKAAAHCFLDVAVGECEFASPFAYSMSLQLRGQTEIKNTDVSQPSARPIFKVTSVLLTTETDVSQEELKISVFASIADPVAKDVSPTARLLGEALLPLAELSIPEGSTASRRVVRSINFLRTPGADAADVTSKQLTVGRATVAMQLKVLTPSESGPSTARTHAEAAPSLAAPPLDRSLWVAAPFEHRICALVHRADSLPAPPEGSRATARVALRLRRPDGQVLYESISTDSPIVAHGSAENLATAIFAQELVLPLRLAEPPTDIRVQLALEIISASAEGGGATTSAVLELAWPPDALPYLKPLHLLARPSEIRSKSSHARPRPSLLVSLVHEPAHSDLNSLGDAMSFGVQVRLHGVPVGRPLPNLAEDAMIAISPEPSSSDASVSDPQVPTATFFYDQPMDFKTFADSHFQSSSGLATSYFLSPILSAGTRAPEWGQFEVRFLASTSALDGISIFLFQSGGGRADPDAPLASSLLGFATLDVRALKDSPLDASGAPLHKSFLLDLRLLEAPGSSTSLELECRVWPRDIVPEKRAVADPTVVMNAPRSVDAHGAHGASSLPNPLGGSASKGSPRPTSSPATGAANAGLTASLGIEAHEFRLNHELSVQLAKEFNLRASALKKAGEEIISLRRQVQLVRGENAKLKAQLEDEEKLAEDVQRRPPPEGFDSLSSAELAAKLQRALEKYRQEKSKSLELGRRLEEAVKEASRGRGLERSLEELETAHLQQNKELQRLQEENRKIDTYRQSAKAQEKVIAKLERLLEDTLQEVQKAQRVQVDMEKLKTENLRLRERCAKLAAARRGATTIDEDVEELRQQLAEKDREIARLEAVEKELRAGHASAAPAAMAAAVASSPEVVAERRRLSELEESRVEWQQRCVAAEHRLSMLQQQLTESSKKYGGEITALNVEVAKREAKVMELEFLLKEKGDAATRAAPLS